MLCLKLLQISIGTKTAAARSNLPGTAKSRPSEVRLSLLGSALFECPVDKENSEKDKCSPCIDIPMDSFPQQKPSGQHAEEWGKEKEGTRFPRISFA
jgi:hypothetical protein